MTYLSSLLGWVNNTKDMAPSNFLSGNSPQTYQRNIWVAKILFHLPNNDNAIEDIDWKEEGFRTLSISHLDNATLLSSRTVKGLFLVRATSQYFRNQMKHNPLHALSSYKSGRSLLCGLSGLYQERNTTGSPSVPALLGTTPFTNEIQPLVWKKCSPIPCASTNTTIATNIEIEKRELSEGSCACCSLWKTLASAAPASIVGSGIGQNLISTSSVLR